MSLTAGKQLLLTSAAGSSAYQISRSLRFSAPDSSFLSRTPASAGNRKTWTWAGWVKRSALATGARQSLFSSTGASDSDWCEFGFEAGLFYITTFNDTNYSSSVYRDTSAWYHVVIAFDTTLATASDRAIIWVNNVRMPITVGIFSQNTDYGINRAAAHNIGNSTFASRYFNGYLADIHFIDGQALDPSSFTTTDLTTGQLIPKAYTGSYGTNGFKLNFSDNSTTAALGTDSSGAGNNWTVNNFSVTSAGNGNYDSRVSATGITYGSISTIFDNNIATGFAVQAGTITYTPSPSTSVSSSIKFWYTTDQSNTQFRVNGGSWITLSDPSGVGTYIHSFTGTLTTIEWNAPTTSELIGLHQIQVDNTVLINNSVAAGNDSLVDTPTSGSTVDTGLGGQVTGNYATWNPLANGAAQLTYSNGNLDLAQSNTASYALPANTIGVSSGKWYWETTITSSGSCRTGVLKDGSSLSTFLGNSSTAYGYASGGYKANSNSNSASGYSSYTSGDVIGVALDLDNGKLYFSKNGTWQESGNPATQTNPAYTGLSGTYFASWGKDDYVNTSCSVNFGQRAFSYQAPSGFKAVCDTSLPAPVVAKGSTAMDVAVYTGTGAAQSITGLAFNPDFVWLKRRSSAQAHYLYDVIRGTSSVLYSDGTDAEQSISTGLTSFNSDGFSLGSLSGVNASSSTYVGWCWDAGTSTVTNTAGSITSQVRANASAGFSISTFTIPGSGACTVGHGLNSIPEFLVVKSRVATSQWVAYHKSLGSGNYILLNTTAASTVSGGVWASTAPTSTVFSIGTDFNGLGGAVCYAFAPVSGYSSGFSYTGNGSADGVFQFLGFRPRLIMLKRSDSTSNWTLLDTSREGYNVDNDPLYPNLSDAEGTTDLLDITSNGFKLRSTDASVNASAATYIGFAWAENPFQYARAR